MSSSVPGSTATCLSPPVSGRMVVGMRTVTAMAAMLPVRFPTHAVDNRRESVMVAPGRASTDRRPIRRVVAAPDKFKGTLSAAEVAAAIGHACWELGIDCTEVPMADGGDGLLDALGGAEPHLDGDRSARRHRRAPTGACRRAPP